MNFEINCTYGNLGLLLLFLCNLGLIHGYFIRFCSSLFVRCCFPTLKAKQGRWLTLPHQRNAHWFTMKAPNPFSVFVNDGYCLAILLRFVHSLGGPSLGDINYREFRYCFAYYERWWNKEGISTGIQSRVLRSTMTTIHIFLETVSLNN